MPDDAQAMKDAVISAIGTHKALSGTNTPWPAVGGASLQAVVDIFGDSTPELLFTGMQTALPTPHNFNYWSETPVIIYSNLDGQWRDISNLIIPNPDDRSIMGLGGTAIFQDFNRDGHLDFLLPGGTDMPLYVPSYLYVGAETGFAMLEVGANAWVHGSASGDLNADGYADVVLVGYPASNGEPGLQIGLGGNNGLTFYPVDFSAGGSGVAIGDFIEEDDAKLEIILTDSSGEYPGDPTNKGDAYLFSWSLQNGNIRLTQRGHLPAGHFEVNPYTGFRGSHDIRVLPFKINDDALDDVIIISLPGMREAGYEGPYLPHSALQILENNGNGLFQDISKVALPGFSYETGADYLPQFIDLNSDDLTDIVLSGFSAYGTSTRTLVQVHEGVFEDKNREFFSEVYVAAYQKFDEIYNLLGNIEDPELHLGGARLVPNGGSFQFIGTFDYLKEDSTGSNRINKLIWSIPIQFSKIGEASLAIGNEIGTYNVSGMAYHWRSHAILDSVQINIDKFSVHLKQYSTGDGIFRVDIPWVENSLTASKPTTASDSTGAIDAADVLAALKLSVGRNPNADPDGNGPLPAMSVSPYQFLAADITSDGQITLDDAEAILLMAQRNPIALSPEWILVDELRNFWDESDNLGRGAFTTTRSSVPTTVELGVAVDPSLRSQINFVGLLRGDADGSWTPRSGTPEEKVHASVLHELAQLMGANPSQWGLATDPNFSSL